MQCPNCSNPKMAKNGKTKAGYQRYRCSKCQHTLTDSSNPHGGSKPIFDRPMTSQEIMDRYKKNLTKNNEVCRIKSNEES